MERAVCSVQWGKCKVGSVECGVWSVKCRVWSLEFAVGKVWSMAGGGDLVVLVMLLCW